MARTIVLDANGEGTEQEDVLRFVLDSTLEEWIENTEAAIDFATMDPTHRTVEEMLEAVGDIPHLNAVLKQIRQLLNPVEVQ